MVKNHCSNLPPPVGQSAGLVRSLTHVANRYLQPRACESTVKRQTGQAQSNTLRSERLSAVAEAQNRASTKQVQRRFVHASHGRQHARCSDRPAFADSDRVIHPLCRPVPEAARWGNVAMARRDRCRAAVDETLIVLQSAAALTLISTWGVQC